MCNAAHGKWTPCITNISIRYIETFHVETFRISKKIDWLISSIYIDISVDALNSYKRRFFYKRLERCIYRNRLLAAKLFGTVVKACNSTILRTKKTKRKSNNPERRNEFLNTSNNEEFQVEALMNRNFIGIIWNSITVEPRLIGSQSSLIFII